MYSEVFPGTWIESENLIKSTTSDVVGIDSSPDSSPLLESLSTTYNGIAAADYAERWAMGYNPLYHTLANDSTGFASQALKAGGWEETGTPSQIGLRGSSYRWYYGNDIPFPSSYSWEDAAYWQSFADTTGRTQRQVSIHSLDLGDIVQYDPDSDGRVNYTMVVTQSQRSGAKEYMVSYHGTRVNALNMPFRSLQMLPGNFSFHKVVSTINLRGE
ncbi:MAG: amidase domain-containing protein [Deinococcaceae bacterium]